MTSHQSLPTLRKFGKILMTLVVLPLVLGGAFGPSQAEAEGSDGYPNLASVPPRPSVSSVAQRQEWLRELEEARLLSEAAPSLHEAPPLQMAQLAPPGSPYYYPSLLPHMAQPIAVIYFPSGGTNLSSRDRDILRQVAELQGKRSGRLLVVGHASRDRQIAGRQSNYELAQRRAQSVARQLGELGINPSQLLVEGRGDLQPRFDESTSAGEAGNRRVELFFVP